MNISNKTLVKLREIINEDSEYRSGPALIAFFNNLGFSDSYGQGFPSRWKYTEDRLKTINGTPNLDKAIRNVFSPINFVDNPAQLDELIKDFNKYLAFDKWCVVRRNAEISFAKSSVIEFGVPEAKLETKEEEFLKIVFNNLSLKNIGLESAILDVLNHRIKEIERSFAAKAPLAVILLAGSTLEGILLGVASTNPKAFNCSSCSPKKDGNVKPFQDWNLAGYIDVARDTGLIEEDVFKFSHVLRDFRNYIHPYTQLSSGFTPTLHTAKICLQVLKVAMHQINENIVKIQA